MTRMGVVLRRRLSFSVTILVAGAFLFFACNDVPTASSPDAGAAELTGPQLAKKGKGPPAGDPSITVEFSDLTTDNIRSDGRGIYADGECGVKATFNLEDARLDPDASKIKPKDAAACGGRDGRFVEVEYSERLAGTSGRPELDGQLKQANFFKVNEVELVTGVAERTAVVHGAGCAHGLKFNSNESTAEFTVNNVEVTRIDPTTWEVHSVAPHVAVCIPDEDQGSPPPRTYWHMPSEITVKLK